MENKRTNCLVCNNTLKGVQIKFCSPYCATFKPSYRKQKLRGYEKDFKTYIHERKQKEKRCLLSKNERKRIGIYKYKYKSKTSREQKNLWQRKYRRKNINLHQMRNFIYSQTKITLRLKTIKENIKEFSDLRKRIVTYKDV